ncbi:MAG: thiamine pyrophosphate-dependent dehydrogenase E1 component subunit alpha [Chloroflexi bacterium]|nr:MAG: thiamine pyrophosphate-dependent dehydrogenase E1 component subunit alpha [Chloroflexota bacterium]
MTAVKEAPAALKLSDEQLLEMYYKMLLARTLSIRQRLLQRMGKGAITYSGEGHEAAQVGTAFALRPGTDWLYTYYRDIGVVLTIGMTPAEVLTGFFATRDDVNSGGRNMPSHFSHKRLRIVSQGAPVATQCPQAVGTAWASKLRGLDEVAAVYFGDGATSTGDWHEAMNFASVHKAPVIFVCEFNQYAISVHYKKQMAVENVALRAQGYGMPGITVDGNDVLAVYEAMTDAVERARGGGGPSFIEAKTYRLVPHSSDDDDRRYRTKDEVESWSARDPLVRFARRLNEMGKLDERREKEIAERVASEVDEATELGEGGARPDPESALRPVFVEEKGS